jgi:chromosome segregation ATPase
MATTLTSIPEALSKSKLDALQVSVSEVEPDSPPHDIDRLTIQSPSPRLGPPTIVKSLRPKLNDPDICVLPVQDPVRSKFNDPDICVLPVRDPIRLRPSSPTGSVRSSYTSHRRVSRRSHKSHGISRSHHSQVSKELTIQAETEFFALMELMSSITFRSTSLKEVWRKIISERESHCSEMDSMYERIEEFTEIIERHEKEKHSHNHNHEEQKKEFVKLRLELNVAIEASAGYKKKLADRDCELEKAYGEIAEFKDNFKYLKEEHEETKTTLEETQLKLVACEERCLHAEEDAERHHGEIRSWKHKYAELETSRTELTSKFESTHKEMLSFKHTSTTLKKEKHEWLHEKDELEEEMRKCKHHEQEHKRKLREITESYEKKKHEVHELTEKVTKIKHEREEYHKEVKTLKTQLEEAHNKCEAAEHSCRKWRRKHEECDSELTLVREELTSLQTTHTESTKTIVKKTEELRRLIIERDELIEKHHAKCKEAAETHRHLLVVQETLRRTETTVKEKLEIIHTHTEHIERIQHDLVVIRKARDDLSAELTALQSINLSLKLNIETLTSEHHSLTEKLHECETRYEAVQTSMTEYHESSGDVEEEYEELLREAREQKEKAIEMRIEADRWRDEVVGKYEAKCREVERLRGRKGRWSAVSEERGYARSVIEEEECDSIVEGC